MFQRQMKECLTDRQEKSLDGVADGGSAGFQKGFSFLQSIDVQTNNCEGTHAKSCSGLRR